MIRFSVVWNAVVCLSLLGTVGCINVGSRFEIMPRPSTLTAPSTAKVGASVWCPNYPEGTTPTAVQGSPNIPQPLPAGRPANTTSLEAPRF